MAGLANFALTGLLPLSQTPACKAHSKMENHIETSHPGAGHPELSSPQVTAEEKLRPAEMD